MNHTERFSLPQWEKEDQIKMEDFNAAMQAIEDAIPHIAAGRYVGNGAGSRTIDVGFTPRAVIITNNAGATYFIDDYHYYYGGLAATDAECKTVTITDGGFIVMYDNAKRIYSNSSGYHYNYFAIG